MDAAVTLFTKGTHNLLSDEVIPQDSASASSNWITRDGQIQLNYGRQAQGAEGAAGKNYGEHTGYRVDGTAVRFRKVATKIQYLNGSTWTDIITGLTEGDCTFANYQSLAGAFVYVFDPLNNIYKIATANPGSYSTLYDATKNFKGYGFIDKGRTIMWGIQKDPTGLRGSWIDGQVGVSGATGQYTTVTAEAITAVESGTLAFKAGGATRTCFGVVITDTSSGEVFTDNYNGVLVGSGGTNTGTINYTTGAFTISGQSGAGTADYQWENSNLRGVTDFSKSTTRVAGEGFVVRQDQGGDAIKVVIPHDGSYFSLKTRSAYKFTLDNADTSPTNELIRSDIGVNTLRSGVATSAGIIFLNTANPTEPRLQILERNPVGDNFLVRPLFEQFNFAKYDYDDVMVESWDRYVLVGCQYDSATNNTLLMCDMRTNTVDETSYGVRTMTKNAGYVYGGDSVSNTTYELFTGFDDMGLPVENYWISPGALHDTTRLKKIKKLQLRGKISPDQALEVYISNDNAPYVLVGTILGSGDYVDYTTTYAVGTSMIGGATIGGDDEVPVYRYIAELKLRGEKFRKRNIKLVATGIGYVSVEGMIDRNILLYQDKLPKTYRTKQNVSLDGTETDLDNPVV